MLDAEGEISVCFGHVFVCLYVYIYVYIYEYTFSYVYIDVHIFTMCAYLNMYI